MKVLVRIALGEHAPEVDAGTVWFSRCAEYPYPCARPLTGFIVPAIPNHRKKP